MILSHLFSYEKLFFLVVALVGFGFLIFIHELGHFLFCKLFGIPVPIFSIGFGPKLFSRTYKGTEFVFSAVPLGGYVAAGGNEHKSEADMLEKRPFYQGILVLCGGIMCNIIFAYLACLILVFTNKIETSHLRHLCSTKTIESVIENSCASRAGVCIGDTLIAMDGKVIESAIDIRPTYAYGKALSNRTVIVCRDGKNIECSFESKDEAADSFGVLCACEKYQDYSFLEKIVFGLKIGTALLTMTVRGIIKIFSNREIKHFSGFIGIMRSGVESIQQGFSFFLAMLAIISVNLAVVNLIPLPMVDGGQVALLSWSKLRGKPLTERTQNIFFYFSLLVIGLLTISTTFYDIMRWIGWA